MKIARKHDHTKSWYSFNDSTKLSAVTIKTTDFMFTDPSLQNRVHRLYTVFFRELTFYSVNSIKGLYLRIPNIGMCCV